VTVRQLLRRADDLQQRRPWLAFPAAVIRKFSDDRAGGLAALIAYYGFFSLFPLLLVLTTVAAYIVHGDTDLQRRIVDSALAQFPVVGTQIRASVGSISGNAVALVFGVLASLWGGLAVLASVQTAMDEVWDVPRRERAALIGRILRGLVVLLALGASVVAATLVAGLSASLGSSVLMLAAGLAVSAFINVVTMAVVFRSLTIARVSWGDVAPGAALAGVVWTGLQGWGGYIVDRHIVGAGDTYGAFAVVIGLLSWLYLGAQLTVLAAEVNVVRRDRLWPRSFFPPPTGPQDERSLTLQARQEEAVPGERVSVAFDPETSDQEVKTMWNDPGTAETPDPNPPQPQPMPGPTPQPVPEPAPAPPTPVPAPPPPPDQPPVPQAAPTSV
jgi:membrane protein